MRSVSPATRVELKSISEARNHARSAAHSRFGDCQALANAGTSYVVNASKLLQQEQLSEQLQQGLESRILIVQATGITPSSTYLS